MAFESWPLIIQGGMGVGVSGWRLAQAVSATGQLGVVSGTALDQVFVRRLQKGDIGGHLRRALEHFPGRALAERIWQKYFIEGGKAENEPYRMAPPQFARLTREFNELCVLANFVEIFLARQGHSNPVGVNFMEKLQPPHLPSIYGALLAGVDFILMGAGIPMKIPGMLQSLARGLASTYPLRLVSGAHDEEPMEFDPGALFDGAAPELKVPRFLPIVSSAVLAATLKKKANGPVDGFIVEMPTAGGHNAPPRGKLQLNELGEPVYGERDKVDLGALRDLGLPFWLAGGYGHPEALGSALAAGATGVQVGTAFAFCDESDLDGEIKRQVLARVADGTIRVLTDPLASPTGFPFKVVQLDGTLSASEVVDARERVCDLGYLREAYRDESGAVRFRCPSEPERLYVSKGGTTEECVGRKCICNGLLAAAGLGQVRDGVAEPPIVTAGDDLEKLDELLAEKPAPYRAGDVVEWLLSGVRERTGTLAG